VPIGAAALIDELESVARGARSIPLTTQVRLDKERFYDVLDRLRAVAPSEASPAIDELDDLIHSAKPVPLTDQVRLNPARLNELVAHVRAAAT